MSSAAPGFLGLFLHRFQVSLDRVFALGLKRIAVRTLLLSENAFFTASRSTFGKFCLALAAFLKAAPAFWILPFCASVK